MNTTSESAIGADVSREPAARDWRKQWRLPLMIGWPLIAVIVALVFYWRGGRYEETSDAYVQIARVSISSNVAGRVEEIVVRDNQSVHKGDVLYRLDAAPLKIAAAAAEAQTDDRTP